jgi:CheY-like chemotaxis protein
MNLHHLVVDDNRALAENIAEILRDSGAEVTVAGSGHEALDLVKQRRFDSLITDMRMPVMNGAVLVHEIRALDPGLPAIVITAYTGESDLADARNEGVLAVLPKPVPIPQLESLLEVARRDGLVALVEDDRDLADNLSEVLRSRGFTAVTARSALEAERLGGVRPFAALVDLRLPDAPTGEIIAHLEARFPGLPLVVVTGHPDALPPGGVKHPMFIKPFDTSALLGELERLHAAATARSSERAGPSSSGRAGARQ